MLDADTQVRHPRFGHGRVVADTGVVVVVHFEDIGVQACPAADLSPGVDPGARLASGRWDEPLETLLRAQAAAIRSAHERWGVFSRSRIRLYPHQLWVCRRVTERWPTRWLVADDVGLGKTVEAGLIVSALQAAGLVRRLLVLAPAALVEQWQERMAAMFDLRLSRYVPEADSRRSDFWNSHHQVVASAHTLRLDRKGRWDRLMEADPWDLVLVDEAHHLHVSEKGEETLAFRLVSQMERAGRVRSLVFFTGTPHRGKERGFLSLVSLLRPDLFDPRRPYSEQLQHLPEVMVRNNKARVTDMDGRPLFKPITVSRETYHYSEAEEQFYAALTEFIATGRAFASSMRLTEQRSAMLVLIAMQKLASSSVAAVRQALATRRERLSRRVAQEAQAREALREAWDELLLLTDEDEPADLDRRAALEERIAELADAVTLNPDELSALDELLVLAGAVGIETKIERIVEVIADRFAGRAVLLFTEYKATQALLVNAIERLFGTGSTVFINGDSTLGVVGPDGVRVTRRIERSAAADQFNRGEVRFLVSTEAAGEGIDLHHACSALIHADLPWNPMRLHQRVGRLSRLGQEHPVDVVILRNPDTVEGLIWDCLNAKLESITGAFRSAMDDPEDMLQVVLGMASPQMWERIFSEAPRGDARGLRSWFDAQTATFGGRDAVALVRETFGQVSRFDFGSVSADLPRVDLADLRPFFRGTLVSLGRRPEIEAGTISFLTPEAWRSARPGIRPRYDGLAFDRRARTRDEVLRIVGVGHVLMDLALSHARNLAASIALIPEGRLSTPLLVVTLSDRLTDPGSRVGRVVVGVAGTGVDDFEILPDWKLLLILNQLVESIGPNYRVGSALHGLAETAMRHMLTARAWCEGEVHSLQLPFRIPFVHTSAILWPETSPQRDRSTGLPPSLTA